jgi:hypothetical protein
VAVHLALPFVAPDQFPTITSVLSSLAVNLLATALIIAYIRNRNEVEADRRKTLTEPEAYFRSTFEQAAVV